MNMKGLIFIIIFRHHNTNKNKINVSNIWKYFTKKKMKRKMIFTRHTDKKIFTFKILLVTNNNTYNTKLIQLLTTLILKKLLKY